MRDQLRKNATWILLGCLGVGATSIWLLGGQRSKTTVLASAEPVERRVKPNAVPKETVRRIVSQPNESISKGFDGRRIRNPEDDKATIRRDRKRDDKIEVQRKKPLPGC